jgi:hypothetical protein
MGFGIPRPSDVLRVADEGRSALTHALGLLPRVVALTGQLEQVMARVQELMAATAEMERRAGEALERTEALVDRTDPLLARFESTLEELEPALRRISETAGPTEVDAIVRLIHRLPVIVDRVESDVLPIVEGLRTVAPDIHDLLDTSKDLNDMIGSVPGLRHVNRRIDDNERIQDEEWASNLDKTQERKDRP